MPDEIKQQFNLTIFDHETAQKERASAITAFITGRTPQNEVRTFTGRGGKELEYVNGYYMFRQASLITGFRWVHELVSETLRPQNDPKEIITKVKVTFFDANGNSYTHPGTGSKDVARYANDDPKGNYKKGDIISLGDDMKSAETDAIKKALSYFGIANDIYGQRELDFGGDNEEIGDEKSEYKIFSKWLAKNHILFSQVRQILGIDKIEDYKEAYNQVKEWYKNKEDRELIP